MKATCIKIIHPNHKDERKGWERILVKGAIWIKRMKTREPILAMSYNAFVHVKLHYLPFE